MSASVSFLGGYDMDRDAKTALLTSLICMALSSGTAYAANDAAITAGTTVPQGMVYELTGHKQNQTKAKQMPDDKQLQGEDPSPDLRARMHWEAVAKQEPAAAPKDTVVKPQPIIITAQDIRRQQKEARKALRNNKKAQQAGQQWQPQLPPTPGSLPAAGTTGAAADWTPLEKEHTGSTVPSIGREPGQSQPASAPGPALPPQPAALPRQPEPARVPEQSGTMPADRLPQEQLPPVARAAAPQPPEGKSGNRPPQPLQGQPGAQPPMPPQAGSLQPPVAGDGVQPPADKQDGRHHHHRRHVRPYQPGPQQPPRLRRDTPRTVDYGAREPEFAGISNEVYRHIKAGIFAMTMQLSQEPTEHGVYELARILCANDKLTRLQKIDYLIGFGWAINHSRLSDWQKGALIDAVLQAFD